MLRLLGSILAIIALAVVITSLPNWARADTLDATYSGLTGEPI